MPCGCGYVRLCAFTLQRESRDAEEEHQPARRFRNNLPVRCILGSRLHIAKCNRLRLSGIRCSGFSGGSKLLPRSICTCREGTDRKSRRNSNSLSRFEFVFTATKEINPLEKQT